MMNSYDKKTGFIRWILLLLVFSIFSFTNTSSVTCSADATVKSYTISTKSTPSKPYINYTTYNKYTRYYYVFRDILTECELNGGGTITVKRGTYTISNVLCIPSNVTLILEDGVVINKGTMTGTSKFSVSKSIFQLIKPSKLETKGYYKQYEGEKNISIIGNGTVIIDLQDLKDSIALILGHNENISISGISFKNLNSGHFIEMDASKNVRITGCSFIDSLESLLHNKEAINLDTPDALTGGFKCLWSSLDKTPDMNITIESCTFQNIDCAIGTHRYSQQQDANGKYTTNIYHSGIKVNNCKFYDIRNYVFDASNWKDVEITNCEISGGSYQQAVYPYTVNNIILRLKGVDNVTFKNNTCRNVGYIAKASYLSPTPSDYNALYSALEFKLTVQNIKDLIYNNTYTDVKNCLIEMSPLRLGSIIEDSSYLKFLRYSTVSTKNDRIALYVGLNYKTYAEWKSAK